jgi:hypothetical protein
MPTERIDATSRGAFLEGFAGQHRGWLVTVEQIDGRGNRSIVIDEQPLWNVGIDGDAIEIDAGTDDDADRVRHRVDGVTDLLVERVGEGAIAAVRIVTASGETVIRFRVVISPELVDGMA